MKSDKKFNCTIEASMCFIGGKYKPIILWHLIDGEKRFSELQRSSSDSAYIDASVA